jgi:hypothetical protein
MRAIGALVAVRLASPAALRAMGAIEELLEQTEKAAIRESVD